GGARRRPGLRRHSPAARDDTLTVGRLITCLISRQAVPTRGEDGMSLGLTRQRPGELPLEVTPFVGRHRELAELTGLLRTARLARSPAPAGWGRRASRCGPRPSSPSPG